MKAAQAEYGRRKLAQVAKKLALAALLCRLAVGSANVEQFDQQLQKTIHKQRHDNQDSLPVISGDIREPEGKRVLIILSQNFLKVKRTTRRN